MNKPTCVFVSCVADTETKRVDRVDPVFNKTLLSTGGWFKMYIYIIAYNLFKLCFNYPI